MKQQIIIAILYAQSMTCMEEIWHNPNHKHDIHNRLAQRYFGHENLCSLALVDKKWNTFVTETAHTRHAFLAKQEDYCHNLPTGNITWHKHKSAYAYWTTQDQKLFLYLVYVSGNNKIQTHIAYGPQFIPSKPVPTVEAQFFDSEGNFKCYIHHFYTKGYPHNHAFRISEYTLYTKKHPQELICLVNMREKDWAPDTCYPLAIFQPYPKLLQAIIRSKRAYTLSNIRTYPLPSREYWLSGVELNEDYILNGAFPQYQMHSSPDEMQKAFASQCIIKKKETTQG